MLTLSSPTSAAPARTFNQVSLIPPCSLQAAHTLAERSFYHVNLTILLHCYTFVATHTLAERSFYHVNLMILLHCYTFVEGSSP